MEVVLIVARADNGVIGADGTDLQRFKSMTMGKPVVMGRKTFLSLPRPLPGRTNIVMTRDGDFRAPGAIVATSLEAALGVATGEALRRFVTEIAVIGGAEIYAQWMDRADRLEVTEVHTHPTGDTHFAPVDTVDWQEIARSRHSAGPGDSADFSFVTYLRRRPY